MSLPAPAPLSFGVPLETVVATLLAVLRITTWLVLAPPFAHRAIPARVKALLALALGLAVAPGLDLPPATLQAGALVVAAAQQVLIGGALGFACYLVFAAVQAAGDLIDLFGGFQLAQAFDPQTQSGSSIFGRFYHFTAIVLLFASDGHLVVLHGLHRSFDVLGVDEGLSLDVVARVVTDGAAQLFLAALQIAGPLIAVLFLTDVGLGLLTRVAPALNAFSLGFPLKIFITLSVAVLAVAVLPSLVDSLAQDAVRTTTTIARGGSGS
ncbi:flagellar biosynthetic protein FliR [Quadrisphaera sp. DSM 44207]|uniref:flagellar biosynthetic protein FliR n=1 Tax=Quadrisphaera sp. DSM 44207 TaxID=1881057 RepID=UPI00088CBE0B|nr:flagellar biosynthetic protein FliR [Quadrisphaera sp. DSM 44207]SDQ19736.1 flagellar biosynthetic protein FliR [Quadrisphaera sp. DSM 44207]